MWLKVIRTRNIIMATTMGQELDPLFLKAVALLHSRHPDSAADLKNLVQGYRDKITGNGSKKSDDRQSPHIENKSSNSLRMQPITQAGNAGNVLSSKRSSSPLPPTKVDTLNETSKTADEAQPNTQVEESIEEITIGSSLQPSAKREKKDFSPDNDPNDSIPIDQIIEMDFGGPTCNICHLSKSGETDNVLVECTECNLSFHQKCHKPPVTTKEVNDPRLLWYCSKCVKKMKTEMAAQQASNTNKPITGTSSETAPPAKQSNPFQQAKPFRRPSVVPSTSTEKTNENHSSLSSLTEESSASAGASTSREGSPSPISKQHNRSRDITRQALNRLEQVKKRAKLHQQNLKQARK